MTLYFFQARLSEPLHASARAFPLTRRSSGGIVNVHSMLVLTTSHKSLFKCLQMNGDVCDTCTCCCGCHIQLDHDERLSSMEDIRDIIILNLVIVLPVLFPNVP